MSARISPTGTSPAGISPAGTAPTRSSTSGNTPRVRRHVAFRIAAGLLALIMLVGFGPWLVLLAPWLVLPNVNGHGWTRTAELHRLADSSASLLMFAVGLAALLLLIRPQGRPALLTWTASMTAVMVAPVSAAIQGNDDLAALIISVSFVAVLVLPLILLNPDQRRIRLGTSTGALARTQAIADPFAAVHSGLSSSPGSGPAPLAKSGLLVLGAAGVALVARVVLWRIFEDIFEDSREDDFLGLATLGLSFALGALLCVRRRTGWLAHAGLAPGRHGWLRGRGWGEHSADVRRGGGAGSRFGAGSRP